MPGLPHPACPFLFMSWCPALSYTLMIAGLQMIDFAHRPRPMLTSGVRMNASLIIFSV
jgi:hypothetical protein